MTLLNTIHSRETLLQLTPEQQKQLCREIREFLVEHISRTGGHLASNLGVVELTLALHLVFDTAQDRIVFDVGHQAYVHKILTGRQEQFRQLRTFGGIAGFPKPSESSRITASSLCWATVRSPAAWRMRVSTTPEPAENR